jgi:hypothetical protein
MHGEGAMATLEPRSDKVVRDAIDAFLDGRLVPDFAGETVFETKNSRYRLLDGVVFAAPDPSLVGAELVGWLCESPRRCLVESAWQPGSRAVLVDRKDGRNIIVTSTTRLLHQEERGSGPYQGGSAKSHSDFRSWHPPAPALHEGRLPTFSPEIIAATPPPLEVVPPPPVPPLTPHSPPPPPLGPEATSPKRVHLPPRPIARPLPAPLPPPRVPAPPKIPAALDPSAVKEVPHPEPAEWALSSAELEMVVEDEPPDDSAPFELQPVNSEPFPLVRR